MFTTPSKSVSFLLSGNLAALWSIHFTSDGCYMATRETTEFLRVYNVKSEYEKKQEIDLFSPEAKLLLVGLGIPTYASLLEYGQHWNFTCLQLWLHLATKRLR